MRVRLNRDHSADFDLPFLWYDWGKVVESVSWANVRLDQREEEVDVMSNTVIESAPPNGKEPRKVELRLFAKRVEKQ